MRTISIENQQIEFHESKKSTRRSRVSRLLQNWFAAQYVLQRHWERYSAQPRRKNVPYRVWSRYGAYLDAHLNDRKH